MIEFFNPLQFLAGLFAGFLWLYVVYRITHNDKTSPK